VSNRERRRGTMMGGRNSLSIHIFHILHEAEDDSAHVSYSHKAPGMFIVQ
jgi:hypothetical protein